MVKIFLVLPVKINQSFLFSLTGLLKPLLINFYPPWIKAYAVLPHSKQFTFFSKAETLGLQCIILILCTVPYLGQSAQ